jgi:hypothetical protein
LKRRRLFLPDNRNIDKVIEKFIYKLNNAIERKTRAEEEKNSQTKISKKKVIELPLKDKD